MRTINTHIQLNAIKLKPIRYINKKLLTRFLNHRFHTNIFFKKYHDYKTWAKVTRDKIIKIILF